MNKINISEVREFISNQSMESKIYIGGDSERIHTNRFWT